MARAASKHPTDGELEILRTLWANQKERNHSCTLAEVCEALRQEREVATTTVATMLRVMLDKGLVKRKKAAGGYQWSAAVSQEKTASSLVGKLVDGVFEGSAGRLVTHLVEAEHLSAAELKALKKLVDSKRGKKGGQP